jgi:hypothetical protein
MAAGKLRALGKHSQCGRPCTSWLPQYRVGDDLYRIPRVLGENELFFWANFIFLGDTKLFFCFTKIRKRIAFRLICSNDD